MNTKSNVNIENIGMQTSYVEVPYPEYVLTTPRNFK